MSVEITRWRSLRAPQGERSPLTWDDLVAWLATPAARPARRVDLPGWAPAVFRGDYRALERVERVTALGLDVDEGAVTEGDLRRLFAGRDAVWHATSRSTPEAPRWRVVLRVSRPMSVAEYDHLWRHERARLAAEGVVLDPNARDASRIWFVPAEPLTGAAYLCGEVEGGALDVDAILASTPVAAFAPRPPTGRSKTPEGGRNSRLTSLGGGLCRLGVEGIAMEAALVALNEHECDPPLDVSEVERIARSVGRYQPATMPVHVGPRIVIEHADVLGAPLPPLHWICERLRLARESVSMFAGYGYSKKTMTLQAAALAHASGRPLFGLLDMAKGSALHVDYEQGARLTRERYQRMARAQGIDLADLGTALGVATFPRLRLSDIDSEDELTRVLEGYTFAVFDSLRAGAPDVEENSSEIRSVIDAAARAGKKVGCAVAIIHHARKPSADANGGKFQIRGSSAIFDACDEVWIFEAEKGEATKVRHEKDRLTGVEVEDFFLDVADVTGPNGDPRWGLEIRRIDGAEMTEARQRKTATDDAKLEAERTEAIRRKLSAHPNATWIGSRTAFAKQVGGRYQATLSTIDALISKGVLAHAKGGAQREAIRWVP